MIDDENAIRDLIDRWCAAITAKDLDGVIAHHTADIVMFDVPPPFDGIRGLSDYRDCWQPFFEYIDSGAIFEIEELDVVAGESAAYAFALLRCGKPEELAVKPDLRLRVTMGLRKEPAGWQIAHEHHSFPLPD